MLSRAKSQGYHVQITARSDRDLSPEAIVQKVADASGSKYSGASTSGHSAQSKSVPPKPAFMPTSSAGGARGFNPLGTSQRVGATGQSKVDEDGWGDDAPPVVRTQLQKVESAYKPTRVNINDLTRQKETSPLGNGAALGQQERPDVVKGAYQPVGKIDISAIRREAQAKSPAADDRPSPVKGSYEPVGKVDIAAIRARAQPQPRIDTYDSTRSANRGASNVDDNASKTLTDRSTAFSKPERLTSLPKPKVSNRFGAGSSNFTGTKAPVPGELGFESKPVPGVGPAGASRTFADQGGKTPAQLWAEKKAKQGQPAIAGNMSSDSSSLKSPTTTQPSSGASWKSGYVGKSWAPVQTTKTGNSSASNDQPIGTQENEPDDMSERPSTGGIHSIRDKYNETPIISAASRTQDDFPTAPPLETSTKPNAGRGVPIPGLAQHPIESSQEPTSRMPVPPPPRSPTPPTPVADEGSPIRLAVPVARDVPKVEDAHDEQASPPPAVPIASLAEQASRQESSAADEPETHDVARAAAANVARSEFGQAASSSDGGKRALAQYDYEKAEDNELELQKGETITNIDMVDEDWWMGQNSKGETGLFPSNYVELVEDDVAPASAIHMQEQTATEPVAASQPPAPPGSGGNTATGLYDYDAAEDNELTFPEGATITNVVSHYRKLRYIAISNISSGVPRRRLVVW